MATGWCVQRWREATFRRVWRWRQAVSPPFFDVRRGGVKAESGGEGHLPAGRDQSSVVVQLAVEHKQELRQNVAGSTCHGYSPALY